MPVDAAQPMMLDSANPRPVVVSEYRLSANSLRQRGALLAGEALADWPLLRPAGTAPGRGLAVGGLPDTLVTLDGLRLTPAADGRVDLSLLPLAWIDGAALSAGPAGVAQGAGALSGLLSLTLAPASAGSELALAGGGQAGRGIGGLDLRLGGKHGWLAGGFTQGGALPGPAGLMAGGQGRWQLGGHVARALGGATTIWARGLAAGRREGAAGARWADAALGLVGGTRWRWDVAATAGGHEDDLIGSSRQTMLRAAVSGQTGLILPGAAEPVALSGGAEWRRLRLGAARLLARDLFADAAIPLLQDRPAAENLVATLGLRHSWLGARAEPLWQAGLRWEFFPGIALRGQAARGIDDLAQRAGTARSIGLIATPAFVPGLSVTLDWRSQDVAAARLRATDLSLNWRGPVGGQAVVSLAVLATRTTGATAGLPQPIPAFASLARLSVESGRWAWFGGWRHRSSLPDLAPRDGLDLGVERQLSPRVRLIATVSNAANAGRADGPVGRQALLQLVAGF